MRKTNRFTIVLILLTGFAILVSLLAASPMAIAQNAPTVTPEATATDETVELPLPTPENIPTTAPTPTGGKWAVPKKIPIPKLARPLTRGQALRKALEFDQRGGVHWQDEAWSLETLKSNPDRIAIEHFDEGTYKPLGDNVKGALWVVTIKGRVRLSGPGGGCLCSGVTYAISEDTGNVEFSSPVGPPLGEHWVSTP